jgi:hypothetical protein
MESKTVFQNLKEKIFSEFSQFFVFDVNGKTYLVNRERVLWAVVDRRYIAIHFEAKRLVIDENSVYYETEELGSQ